MKFRKWLVESQLSRQIAYHGTNQVFRSFDRGMFGSRDWGDFGFGVYLSPNDNLARQYALNAVRDRGGEPIVLHVRMMVDNTIDLSDPDTMRQVTKAAGVPTDKVLIPGQPQTRPRKDAEAITNYLINQGYDSAVARNGREIVVYDPSKLRVDGYYKDDEYIPLDE